jgi:hypothetical protein
VVLPQVKIYKSLEIFIHLVQTPCKETHLQTKLWGALLYLLGPLLVLVSLTDGKAFVGPRSWEFFVLSLKVV